MFFSLCHSGGDVDLETMIEKCRRDRNELFQAYRERFPESGHLLPAQIVRDVIRDICDYGIEERPLPKGQSALCDFRIRRIKLNSRSKSFVKSEGVDDILAWQRSILAHELGHVRLHTDEVEEQVFISSSNLADGFDDPRFFQKENEADLYAAVFMVPVELLAKCRLATARREQFQNADEVASPELWDFVEEMARFFGTTRDLMRYSLELYGWIRFHPSRSRSRTGTLKFIKQPD